MTREKAKDFMWIENNKNPFIIQWQHHKTIRDLHEKLIDKIYDNHDAEFLIQQKENELNVLRSFREGVKTQQKIDYGFNLISKIVVMLFWQWRYFRNSEYRNTFVDARAKALFYKAYNLLKGN